MRRRAVLAVLAGAMPLALAGVAGAQGIGDRLMAAKMAGKVGERPDGLIGAVDASPAAETLQLVAMVNQERRAQYAKIAAQNGISADQVAIVAGTELVDRTPAGQYVLNASGTWVKK